MFLSIARIGVLLKLFGYIKKPCEDHPLGLLALDRIGHPPIAVQLGESTTA